MMVGLLLTHLILSLVLAVYTARRMSKGITLLNTFVLIFVLCCCIGVNLFEFFQDFLPQTQYSDVAITRLAFANIIFMVFAAVALILQQNLAKSQDPNRVGFRIIPTQADARIAVILTSVLICGFLSFWLARVSEVEDPFAAYKETAESGQYYKYRQFVEEDFVAKGGQGTWSAKKLALNIGPFIMVLLGYFFYQTRNWVYLALILLQSFFGVMVAGILAHKAFLLIAIFSPFLAVLIWRVRRYSAKGILSVLALVFFGGATLIFQSVLNSTIQFAFAELIARIFLVPAFVPLFYYEVVPDALPFRGIFETLYIYHSRAPAGDYATFDVAFHATGRAYGANANFLAVAYTGMGFLGVLGVVILCLGLILVMDYFLTELEVTHRIVAVCFSVFGFIGITSINFLGALENGFLVGSLLFFLLCRGSIRPPERISGALPRTLQPSGAAP